jgi:hypothetical protein
VSAASVLLILVNGSSILQVNLMFWSKYGYEEWLYYVFRWFWYHQDYAGWAVRKPHQFLFSAPGFRTVLVLSILLDFLLLCSTAMWQSTEFVETLSWIGNFVPGIWHCWDRSAECARIRAVIIVFFCFLLLFHYYLFIYCGKFYHLLCYSTLLLQTRYLDT